MAEWLASLMPNVTAYSDKFWDSCRATWQMFVIAGAFTLVFGCFFGILLTVTKKGGPNWAYTRAILDRWRARGYRTPEDLERYDRPASQRPETPGSDRDEAYYRMLRENVGKKGGDENADG